MKKENFQTKMDGEESGDRIEGLSQNKTLYVDQFTDFVTIENKGLAMTNIKENGQDSAVYPRTIKEVFAYFKPSIEVEFTGDEGETKEEVLRFNEIKDFDVHNGRGNLINNSPFLRDLRNKIDSCENFRKQMEKNARLRALVEDSDTRDDLKELLESILAELTGEGK